MGDDDPIYIGLGALAILTAVFFALRAAWSFKASGRMIAVVLWSTFIIASCIMPPWIYTTERYHSQQSAGYHVLFNPPEPEHGFGVKLDLARLGLEWLIVSAAIGPFWWITRKKP